MRIHVDVKSTDGRTCMDVKNPDVKTCVDVRGYQRVTSYQDADPYTGPYEVTPTVHEQTLKTREKLMMQDVSVHPVPSYETSNTAGGTTFYIAKE